MSSDHNSSSLKHFLHVFQIITRGSFFICQSCKGTGSNLYSSNSNCACVILSINVKLLNVHMHLYHMCYQDLIKIILFTLNKGQCCTCLLIEVIDIIKSKYHYRLHSCFNFQIWKWNVYSDFQNLNPRPRFLNSSLFVLESWHDTWMLLSLSWQNHMVIQEVWT